MGGIQDSSDVDVEFIAASPEIEWMAEADGRRLWSIANGFLVSGSANG
jgi:hypothetical protein